MKYHDENIIPEVLDVIEKSLRLYYQFKGLQELRESHKKVIKGYIAWANKESDTANLGKPLEKLMTAPDDGV
jgi:hypothetical protein